MYGVGNWGIYTNNQGYALALAVAFGALQSEAPQVHGNGYYGHYHDGRHKFHIWYGGKIWY
jgi:hypothetical protein